MASKRFVEIDMGTVGDDSTKPSQLCPDASELSVETTSEYGDVPQRSILDREEMTDPRVAIYAKLAKEAKTLRKRAFEGKSDAEEFKKRVHGARKEYTDKEIAVQDVKYHWGRKPPIEFDCKQTLLTVCQVMRSPVDLDYVRFIKHFTGEKSCNLFHHVFWYFFIKYFEGGSERTLKKLANEIADKQVLLFWSFGVDKSEFRDRFYKYYLYALEPAITGSFMAHFPASAPTFPADMATNILKDLMLMFVGVPDPMSTQLEIKNTMYAAIAKKKNPGSPDRKRMVIQDLGDNLVNSHIGTPPKGKSKKGKKIKHNRLDSADLSFSLIEKRRWASKSGEMSLNAKDGGGEVSPSIGDVVTVDVDVSSLMHPNTRNTLEPLELRKDTRGARNRKRMQKDVFDVRSMSPIVQRHMVMPLRFKREFFRRSVVNANESDREITIDDKTLREQRAVQESWRKGQEKQLNVLRKAADKFDKEIDTIDSLRDRVQSQKKGELVRRCMSQFVVEKWSFLTKNPVYLRTDLYDPVDVQTDSTSVLNNLIGGRTGNHGYTLARSGLLGMLTS